jgi:hypothetical protein
MEWPFEQQVRALIGHLVRGEYDLLERESSSVRLSGAQMAAAVASYGRHLVDPPQSSSWLDVVPHSTGHGYSVNVAMWTDEEGRSDLTLLLTVRLEPNGGYRIEIDDLHVL